MHEEFIRQNNWKFEKLIVRTKNKVTIMFDKT